MPSSHLAVHYLGGTGPTALYAHATGFHAHCWSTVTALLPGLHNVGYDARGHGDTPIGTGWASADEVDWDVYGHDAAIVARSLSVDGQVMGIGHSMGGAALLRAALAAPELFFGLVLYEPIVMPPEVASPMAVPGNNYLANGARKRRDTFASFEAAIATYGSKPPLNVFTPDSLDAYVRFGFRPGADGHVHLKCTPEHEARTYEGAPRHDTWNHLGEVSVPVWVISGVPVEGQPSARTAALAEQIPGSRYIELDHLGHFGPMQDPECVASLVGEAAMAFNHRFADPFRA